ncbi:MAG: LapA family protein, partial [Pseudomonadales bacterium]
NMETVTVHWFGHPIENVQLALWLLIFFVAGALLGLSVSAVQAMRHQVHVKVLRNQVKATKPKSVSTI